MKRPKPGAIAAGALATALLASCALSREPIKLGLVSGLSGANADLGEAGRNGAMIAVDEINDTGGVNGRKVELFVRDDGNEVERAKAAAAELVKLRVAAIVGPFNATMVDAVRTVTEDAKTLVFTPTASSFKYVGKDDYLFRLNSSTRDNTEDYAAFMTERRAYKRVSIAADSQNKSFSESWLEEFRRAYGARGGTILSETWFDTRILRDYGELARGMLTGRPDAVLLVANTVDVARLAQQIRKEDATVPLVAAEWAGTQQLIEMGGHAVNGLALLQIYDRFGAQKPYLDFVARYKERFGGEPSYSSIMAYETVRAIATALRLAKPGEGIRESIVRGSPYEGLQQTFAIDAFGDSRRKSYFVVVEGNDFGKAP